jgi:hypothetical protein
MKKSNHNCEDYRRHKFHRKIVNGRLKRIIDYDYCRICKKLLDMSKQLNLKEAILDNGFEG